MHTGLALTGHVNSDIEIKFGLNWVLLPLEISFKIRIIVVYKHSY